jgi:hypothetical protein
MNKKLSLLLAGSAIALFFACSGEVVESTETSNRAELALTVTVQDYASGTLLDADVSLNNGEPKKAESGVAVFSNVGVGTHNLLAKKTGYAEMLSQVIVEPVIGQNAQIPRDYAKKIELYPLTSGLWGYLSYADKDGVTRRVPEGIEVKLKLLNSDYYDIDGCNCIVETSFITKLFTATTDAQGKYEFKDLPAVGDNYEIWVSSTSIDDIEFGNKPITKIPLQTEGTVYATETLLSKQTNFFIVSDYPSIIEYADIAKPITLKFTEAVDRSIIKNTSITSISDPVLMNITWNEDNTELTLTPMGNWKTSTIRLISLRSISGKPLFKSLPANPTSPGAAPTNVDFAITVLLEDLSAKPAIVPELLSPELAKINYNSTVYLKYNKIKGATGYSIYTNNNTEGVYKSVSGAVTTISETDDAYIVQLTNSNLGDLIREVGILVQATNTDSKTPLDETKAVKIKDMVKPTFSGATDGERQGAVVSGVRDTLHSNNNYTSTTYFGTNDYTFGSNCVVFSEPIQLDDVKLELKNEGYLSTFNRVKAELNWSTANRTQVCYTLKITGSTTAMTSSNNLDASLIISGIKDLSGNPFEVKYTSLGVAGTGTSVKGNVAIRFYTAF